MPFIGFLVLPNWVRSDEDYFVFAAQEGIHTKLKESGYCLVYNRLDRFNTSDDPELMRFVDSVKGLIILNPWDDEVFANFMENVRLRNIPHVLIGSPDDDNTYYVDMDIVSAAYQSSSALLSKGCKHIVYIDSPKGMKQTSQILKGYSLAHEEREIPWVEEHMIHAKVTSIEEGIRIVESVMATDRKVDGFITPNDVLAQGVVIALQKMKIRIPEDCKVISLGGGVISSQISYPRISSVDYNPYQMGQEAAAMLLDIISKKRMRPTHSVFAAILIERETT